MGGKFISVNFWKIIQIFKDALLQVCGKNFYEKYSKLVSSTSK